MTDFKWSTQMEYNGGVEAELKKILPANSVRDSTR